MSEGDASPEYIRSSKITYTMILENYVRLSYAPHIKNHPVASPVRKREGDSAAQPTDMQIRANT